MAPTAEVRKLTDGIERDRLIRGNLARHLDLVRIGGKLGDRGVAGDLAPRHRIIGRDDLGHPAFEAFEIVGRKRLDPVEIVVEAVLDCRSDRRLRLGKKVLDGISQDVGRGMPQFGKRRPGIVNHGAATFGEWLRPPSTTLGVTRRRVP